MGKQQFYKTVKQLYQKYQSKHIIHVAVNVNARAHTQTLEAETGRGVHTFNKGHVTLDKQDEHMEENRQLFLDLCLRTNTTRQKTQLKENKNQPSTHRMSTDPTPLFTRPLFEMMDYWPTATRLKSCIINTDTENNTNLNTDHLPMAITTKNKPAAFGLTTKKRQEQMQHLQQRKAHQFQQQTSKHE